MQTLDIVAALLLALPGIAGWLAWGRAKGRIARRDLALDRGVWLGQSTLAFILVLTLVTPTILLLLRLGRHESGLFYAREADGLLVPFMLTAIVALSAARPLSAPSSLRPEATVPREQRVVLRDVRWLALASLASGLSFGFCLYRLARAELTVSERCVQREAFWGEKVRICSDAPYTVVEFERRGGVLSRSRRAPHFVLLGGNRKSDLYFARHRHEELSRALARVFPAPRVARELHRVGFWGETIEGLEGLP